MGGEEPMTTGDDRVLPATRALSVGIIPFLVVAFVVLYGFPGDTDDLFAWTIAPTLTSMVLGGVYLGGAYFFVRAARSHQWHSVKAGFVSVAAFASMMGITTIIHWDRFNHGHVAFWLWAGLYFTTPFLVLGVWAANRRTEAGPTADDVLVPPAARYFIGAAGLMAVGVGLFLFVAPSRMADMWPWALTPLTARALGAIFMLGLAGIGVFVDRRWSAARLMVQVAALMMVLILGGAARAHRQLDGSNAMTWLLLAGFAATLVGAVALSVRMEGRPRATA